MILLGTDMPITQNVCNVINLGSGDSSVVRVSNSERSWD